MGTLSGIVRNPEGNAYNNQFNRVSAFKSDHVYNAALAVSVFPAPVFSRVDYSKESSDGITYIGYAAPGVTPDQPLWRICKITDQNDMTNIGYAVNPPSVLYPEEKWFGFVHKWDDREVLAYANGNQFTGYYGAYDQSTVPGLQATLTAVSLTTRMIDKKLPLNDEYFYAAWPASEGSILGMVDSETGVAIPSVLAGTEVVDGIDYLIYRTADKYTKTKAVAAW